MRITTLSLLLGATTTTVLAHQPRPAYFLNRARRVDSTSDSTVVVEPVEAPYPYCDPEKDEFCITEGKYLLPQLEIQNPDDKGDTAYKKHLPTHDVTLKKWTNGLMPAACYAYGVETDGWKLEDFEIYNATFSDCSDGFPFVICYNVLSQKTPEEIATEISILPAGMRQSTNTFLVYSDEESDNPSYKGFIGAACQHGIMAGISEAYFITALVHEIGHAIDCTLASPDALPGGWGTEFSNTSAWQDAVDEDEVAVSPYGTTSYVENFAEAGRLVLMDNVFPGGLKAFAGGNHPNITQLKNQLDAVKKSKAGKYFEKDGECDPEVQFPFPTQMVNVTALLAEGGNNQPSASATGGGPKITLEPRPGQQEQPSDDTENDAASDGSTGAPGGGDDNKNSGVRTGVSWSMLMLSAVFFL